MTTDQLNESMAIPEMPIKLPDGRTLIIRNWEPSISVSALLEIKATFLVKDQEGYLVFCTKEERDADLQRT